MLRSYELVSTSFLMVENYPRSPTAVRRRAAGDYSGGSHSSYAANTLEVEPILVVDTHNTLLPEARRAREIGGARAREA